MTTEAGRHPATAPAARRDAIDVARVLALLVVVLGHLLLAVIDRPRGEIRGANLLALHPGWAWIAVLSPMPVFFAAAGWANSHSTAASAAPRLRALVGLGAVAVCGWSVAVAVAVLSTGEPGVVGDGARLATQPLWFVAAYVPFAAAGARLAWLGDRHPGGALAVVLTTLAAIDVARFALGAPDWIGWPAFYLAWGTPWVAGAWWRARCEAGAIDERRAGATLALVAGTAAALLVALAEYDPALIDAVDGARSNTNPPTLYTAVVSLAQVGVLLVGAHALDVVGRRWRSWWDRLGEAAVGVYVWHLTALTLCAAVIAAGFPVPERLTIEWWSTRPLWWAAVLALTMGFVGLTASARSTLAGRSRRADPPSVRRVVAGVVVAALAGAYVGLEGPATVPQAAVSSASFVGAWLLLRSSPAARAPGGTPAGRFRSLRRRRTAPHSG